IAPEHRLLRAFDRRVIDPFQLAGGPRGAFCWRLLGRSFGRLRAQHAAGSDRDADPKAQIAQLTHTASSFSKARGAPPPRAPYTSRSSVDSRARKIVGRSLG